jgi:small subunit ribosomal protein S16
MDKRKSAKGRALEVLGSVNPHKKDIILNTERIQYWLGVGAEASDRVYNILVSKKVIEGKKRSKKIRAKKKEEKEGESAPAPAVAADKPAATEGPKEQEKETVAAELVEEIKSEEKIEEDAEKKDKKIPASPARLAEADGEAPAGRLKQVQDDNNKVEAETEEPKTEKPKEEKMEEKPAEEKAKPEKAKKEEKPVEEEKESKEAKIEKK